MELQNQVAEIRSLAPIQALSPLYSIQRKPWYKVYRAQCMIPLPMYSLKIVYIITFIAFKIYVRVQLYIIPMVFPNAIPIEYPEQLSNVSKIQAEPKPIPIASYSYNCIYCARCNLGMSCKSHFSGLFNSQKKQENKEQQKIQTKQQSEKKQEKKQQQQPK